ncbi:altronate oxidoreductase [Formosa agariphila KMM 3901]|uniref:Altronate oxidoreductase n=1 Tax=Formosa agariphila (strain DSM 15362 / KCTC 12365 / LMG 23005 / KMM 3901 / M-2Alg 35-1) TaxID=1347342 RepID=T2KP95_FORAG|nr:tagaturonate reductase [Formosa agariphila]CDF79794.1 altronate oxidoreductase [Formosa agariphila KMM 3901]
MKNLNRTTVYVKSYTERIIQFGEGNFLRAFADWMIHEMNKKVNFDAGVVAIQPIDQGLVKMLNDQDGLYTLYLNGIKKGKSISEHEIIDCIQRGINPYENYADYLAVAENPNLRFVISNTTEAGISYDVQDKLEDAPQSSFPGKLTALLYKRFQVFKGASDKGLIVIPCELIDKNGDNLKRIILQYAENWNLGSGFMEWINYDNIFCNTLVDRIVPGYPKDKMESITEELGYKDNLVVEGEQFHLWVIEGPASVKDEIPAEACGLNIVFTDNMEPYRTRKVRILNGAHTTLVPVGYLYGIDKVRESLEDDIVGTYLKNTIFNEICPTLDLPESELNQFSNDVLDRFRNPYLEHELMSISLNTTSKFKTRVLPSVLEYIKRKNALPKGLLFSLAALIAFYKGDRNGEKINLKDDQFALDFFETQWATGDVEQVVKATLEHIEFWGADLSKINGLQETVTTYLQEIVNNGMQAALQDFLKN